MSSIIVCALVVAGQAGGAVTGCCFCRCPWIMIAGCTTAIRPCRVWHIFDTLLAAIIIIASAIIASWLNNACLVIAAVLIFSLMVVVAFLRCCFSAAASSSIRFASAALAASSSRFASAASACCRSARNSSANMHRSINYSSASFNFFWSLTHFIWFRRKVALSCRRCSSATRASSSSAF